MKYPTSYCVYDTETTGLETSTCEILELAAKRVKSDGTFEARSWLIKNTGHISDEIVRITGITQKEVDEKGVPAEQAIGEFVVFAGTAPLVGHNILRYDNLVMARYLQQNGHPPIDINRCVDTAGLFKARELGEEPLWYERHLDFVNRILDIRAFGLKFNLSATCQKLGVDVKDLVAHRAPADVEMTDRVYKKLTAKTA